MGLQPAFGGPVSYKKCVQILIFVVTIEGPFLIFVFFPRTPTKEGGVPLWLHSAAMAIRLAVGRLSRANSALRVLRSASPRLYHDVSFSSASSSLFFLASISRAGPSGGGPLPKATQGLFSS